MCGIQALNAEDESFPKAEILSTGAGSQLITVENQSAEVKVEMTAVFGIPAARQHGCCFAPKFNVREMAPRGLDPYPAGIKPTKTRASILSTSATACCPRPRPKVTNYQSGRDPYPYPQRENDDDFKGARLDTRQPLQLEDWQYRTQDPWDRVFRQHTLSSLRHEWCCPVPSDVPRDKLDFALRSVYRHLHEVFTPEAETVIQKETLNLPHNHVLRNHVLWIKPKESELRHPLRIARWPQKIHPDYVKKAIRGHHTQLTNAGYSRKKEDGTLFV